MEEEEKQSIVITAAFYLLSLLKIHHFGVSGALGLLAMQHPFDIAREFAWTETTARGPTMKHKLATQGITILIIEGTPIEVVDYDNFYVRICNKNVAKIIKIWKKLIFFIKKYLKLTQKLK